MKQTARNLTVDKSLTPVQLEELEANPQAYSRIPFVRSCDFEVTPLVPRRQKLLWLIAGIGIGLALAWVALMIGILWVV